MLLSAAGIWDRNDQGLGMGGAQGRAQPEACDQAPHRDRPRRSISSTHPGDVGPSPGVRPTQNEDALGNSGQRHYRIRFYNFNMANSTSFGSVQELQGPGGVGKLIESVQGPMGDGSSPDLIFATLVETRVNISECTADFMSQKSHPRIDSILAQNARREGANNSKSRTRTFLEGIAASYNGNLKSVLAFSSSDFDEDAQGALFGRLTETTVAGLAVPNPKKAFMGRSLVEKHEEGIRVCFVSGHFPIAKLAAGLEDGLGSPLENTKVALAQTLRKVLRNAAERGVANEQTILVVQGDLNSRTVVHNGEYFDVLHEVLGDSSMQRAIQHELRLPPGSWAEVAAPASVNDLPVTYKFQDDRRCEFPGDSRHSILRLGDLFSIAQLEGDVRGSSSPTAPRSRHGSNSSAEDGPKIATENYRRLLLNLGEQQLNEWGLAFKKNDFRAFRFPASADRVIYWLPDSLRDRVSWKLIAGGYEVNHNQLGSDHRPVSLEAILTIARKNDMKVEKQRTVTKAETGPELPRRRLEAVESMVTAVDHDQSEDEDDTQTI